MAAFGPCNDAGRPKLPLSSTRPQAEDIDQLWNNDVGREDLLGEAARFAGSAFVISFDRAQRLNGFRFRVKELQAEAAR